MDGDFAPITELVKLRREHDFLLVIDDVSPSKKLVKSCTHGTHQIVIVVLRLSCLVTHAIQLVLK